jgi:hypothetical protein
MDRKFGSNMSYDALEYAIKVAKEKYGYSKSASVALDWVLDEIKMNYTIKGD